MINILKNELNECNYMLIKDYWC